MFKNYFFFLQKNLKKFNSNYFLNLFTFLKINNINNIYNNYILFFITTFNNISLKHINTNFFKIRIIDIFVFFIKTSSILVLIDFLYYCLLC